MNLWGDCGMVSDRRRDASWLLGSPDDNSPAVADPGDVGDRLASLGYDNVADYQRDTGIGPGDGTLTQTTLDSLASNSTPLLPAAALVPSGVNVGVTSGRLPPVPPNPSTPSGPNLQDLIRQDAAGVTFDVTSGPTSSSGGLLLAGAAALLGVALLRRRKGTGR